jgi:hypothetical protein
LADEKSEIGTDRTTETSFKPRLGMIDCKKVEAVGEGTAGTLSSGFACEANTVGTVGPLGTIPPFRLVKFGQDRSNQQYYRSARLTVENLD